MYAIVLAALLFAAPAEGPQWKAGVARAKITPAAPVWMSGYAARNHPSEGVLHDLWAKALVLESGPSQRVVIVTADLIALPRELCDELAEHAQETRPGPLATAVQRGAHAQRPDDLAEPEGHGRGREGPQGR